MLKEVSNNLAAMFGSMPMVFVYGFSGLLLILAGFLLVKGYWRMRGNSAFTSYQYGVVAPVEYGDRGPEELQDAFTKRLEHLVEEEEAYDMAKLLPKARELGAIAKSSFRTAPVLANAEVEVLALIEDVVHQLDCGFRVFVHTRLESLVDLEGLEAKGMSSRLSMTGVDLKFAVVDRYGQLVAALEYLREQPLGRQENINRSVVIEVLRKAGVWYLEIPYNYSEEDAKAQLTAVLFNRAAEASENRANGAEGVA